MSIDHNRIKVSDLETNQPDKILATNNSGELEFTDISHIKVDNYNNLDYIAEGKALDARQGKVLKDSIDLLNTVLLGKENVSNKVQDIDTNKNSSSTFPSIKATYDWATALFKTWLLGIENFSGTTYTVNITNINKRTVFTSTASTTLTIPIDSSVSIPIGTKKEITQKGTGIITISGTGITFVTSIPLTMVTGETRILTKIDTNTWTVEGNSPQNLTIIKETYYISAMYGNDLTGVLGSQEKMFSTLNGAVSHYKLNSPLLSATVVTDYTFKIMDGKAYTLTQSIMQSYTGNVNFAQYAKVKITSDHSCTITISNPNTANLVIMTDSLGVMQSYSRLYIILPIGTLTISGTNPVQISQVSTNSTKQAYQILGLRVAYFNMSQSTNTFQFSLDSSPGDNNAKQGTGVSFCEIDNLNITANGTLIAAVHPSVHVKIKNITSTVSHSIIYLLGGGTFSFDSISATTNFNLVANINGTINHGDISCSYATSFLYLGSIRDFNNGSCYINYKNKCKISGNLYISVFNGTDCIIYLTGTDVTYINNTTLIGTINAGQTVPVQVEINIRKLKLNGSLVASGSRNSSGIRLIDTYLELNGMLINGFNTQLDANTYSTNLILLETYGRCYVNYLGTTGTVIVRCDYIPSSYSAFVNIFGDLTIYNGIISTSSNVIINKKTINQTSY